MNIRSIGRILLLVLATVAVTFSCTYDYWLDFELGVPTFLGTTVSVPYWMENVGSRDMDNASIHIEVSINSGLETLDLWTPDVDLGYAQTVNDTLVFTFMNTVTDATAAVIGSRWDEAGLEE